MSQESVTNPYEEDAALVARCLDGDKSAWADLIDRHRRLIYSVPVRVGLRPDQADEVFQDVCVKLLGKLDTLREGRSLVRWLIVTTQRRSWDVAAADRRWVSDTPADDQAPRPERADSGPLGDEVLVAGERAHLVRRGMAELSEVCRAILDGLFFRDPPLSYKELGEELGRPHGSLGPTRIRCLKRLREIIDDWGFQ